MRGIYFTDPEDAKKEQRNAPGFGKLKRKVVNPTRFQRQSMHASWRLLSPRDNVWNHLYRKIMKITSAGKRYNSMTHHNLVHKFIPVPQAMKIPDAKAAVGKEQKRLETIPAWQLDKVKCKKEVILEGQRDKKNVLFATQMDICHLKNAESEKSKGRVVLRGDIVKDDSGAYAVFTEQGSSASRMTAAKVMDVIARLPDCDGQAADARSSIHSGREGG